MNVITLLFTLFFWNWLGGLVLGLVFGAIIVAPFLVRMKNDPTIAQKLAPTVVPSEQTTY